MQKRLENKLMQLMMVLIYFFRLLVVLKKVMIGADCIKYTAGNHASLATDQELQCNLSHDLKMMRHNQMKMNNQRKYIDQR